jgi:hypothetical protein
MALNSATSIKNPAKYNRISRVRAQRSSQSERSAATFVDATRTDDGGIEPCCI